mgnify:CR=1 FL=1
MRAAVEIDSPRPPDAAYVHVPFCRRRCGYCNFTLIADRDDLVEAYLAALERELQSLETPRPVSTLFLGGGTPSHLAPTQLERLLAIVRKWFPLRAGYEFSLEANPHDVDDARLDVLCAGGVGRLSVGGQSFDAAKLRLLERDHAPDDVCRAVERARSRGLTTSLDLIFGAPGETSAAWHRDLDAALALRPEHLSLYGLTFERGTTFWSRLRRGELQPPGEEVERQLYLAAIERLTAAGYEHYEVSNFALPGYQCRHNSVYWQAREYYAAGPGASRYVGGVRETNHRSTTTWLARVNAGRSPVADSERLPPEDRAREALVLGLRRRAGIDCRAFAAEFGYDVDSLESRELRRLIETGLLERTATSEDAGDHLRLTPEGLLLADYVWSRFLRR